jgi:hypothetical protein
VPSLQRIIGAARSVPLTLDLTANKLTPDAKLLLAPYSSSSSSGGGGGGGGVHALVGL